MSTLTFQPVNQNSTQEAVSIDSVSMRLSHMRLRANRWAGAMTRYQQANPAAIAFMGIALTYRPGVSHERDHMRDFMRKLRWWLQDDFLGSIWVVETQKRGAAHYHLCLAVRPGAKFPTKPLISRRGVAPDDTMTTEPHFDTIGWWPHGSTTYGTEKHPHGYLENVSASYLTKYLQKGCENWGELEGKRFRLFAAVIKAPVDVRDMVEFKLSAAPGYVRRTVLELASHFAVVGRAFDWARIHFKILGHYEQGWIRSLRKWGKVFVYDGGWEVGIRATGNMNKFVAWRVVEPEWRFLGVDGDTGGGVDRSYMEGFD